MNSYSNWKLAIQISFSQGIYVIPVKQKKQEFYGRYYKNNFDVFMVHGVQKTDVR